jgi:hypothetical protein
MVYENEQNYRIYPAEKDYKTTHFTIQTNPDSYLLYGDKKVFWKKNVFDELDLLLTNANGKKKNACMKTKARYGRLPT